MKQWLSVIKRDVGHLKYINWRYYIMVIDTHNRSLPHLRKFEEAEYENIILNNFPEPYFK